MAHPPRVKAQAMAMLMTGDTVGYVSKTLGVPKQTVSRWHVDADTFLREIVAASPKLRALAAEIRRTLPGLYAKNGTKKRVFQRGKKGSPSGASEKR